MTYTCSCCGQSHDDLPDLVCDQPSFARQVPSEERVQRVYLDSDLCVVDDEHYFIRGVLQLPIRGEEDRFLGMGAWVSQKRENFESYVENFDSSEIGPFFGWLSNELAYGDESTLSLKTMVHFRGEGLRPRIELEPTDHPLAVAQREGITLEEAWEFVHQRLSPPAAESQDDHAPTE